MLTPVSGSDHVGQGETPEQLEKALRELGGLFDLVHEWQLQREGGLIDVAANSALAGDDKATDPFQTSHLVRHLMGVSVDHLHCLRAAVQEANSIHTFAPYTLLRGSIEAAATVVYLLTPKRRDDRVIRRLQLAHGDDMERQALAVILEEPMVPSPKERLARLRQVEARRFTLNPTSIGARPPGYLTMVQAGGDACTLGGRLASASWRVCSAFAHGRQWAAISMLDMEEISEATDTVLHVRITSSASMISSMTQVAVLFTYEARRLFELRAAPR